MNGLAIDCTTEILSLSLCKGTKKYSLIREEGLRHSENLMPSIDWLFQEAGLEKKELDLVVCAIGPGSFTGLRIGLSTAKAIARGTDSSLVALPSLDPYGRIHCHYPGVVMPLIDAKKGRFYSALYQKGERISDYLDIPEEELYKMLESMSSVLLTGPHMGQLTAEPPIIFHQDPQAKWGSAPILLEMGIEAFEKRGADSLDIGPMYLRKSEAELSSGG